jgi:hypothetical protein
MGAKSDKLMESYGGRSNSDRLRIWIIKFLEDMSSGGVGLATEATLQSVLAAIQNGQDYEAKLVVDDNGNGTTYLEVRIWNPDTQTWETPLYYAAGSNTGVPLGSLTAPVIYINPNNLLATIAANTTDNATETTLNNFLTAFNSEDFASETTLALINTSIGNIETSIGNIETDANTLATPSTGLAVGGPIRATGVGSVTAGKRRISIFNAGGADADVNGGANNLAPGEMVTWSADGLRDTLGAVAYDGSGTELVITTVG